MSESLADLAAFSKGELAKLVTTKWLGRVVGSMADTIEESFAEDQVLRPVKTKDEITRRFKFCARWFITLRRDLNWSVPRILDALPRALRHELDGTPFDPDGEAARQGWIDESAAKRTLVDEGDTDAAPEVPEVTGGVEAGTHDELDALEAELAAREAPAAGA